MEQDLEPISVTVKTACRITGLGPTTIYELIAADAVRSTKVKGRRLLDYASLKKLIRTDEQVAA